VKSSKLLFSRCDGTRIEMVSIEDGKHVHVMEWPEALNLALEIQKYVREIVDLPALTKYLEFRRGDDRRL